MTREGIRIDTPYTHRQLGTMIGANREAVTRAMSELREEGAVEVVGRRIHRKDHEALEREAQARPARETSPRRRYTTFSLSCLQGIFPEARI